MKRLNTCKQCISWNPKDPCLGWKRSCLGAVYSAPKSRTTNSFQACTVYVCMYILNILRILYMHHTHIYTYSQIIYIIVNPHPNKKCFKTKKGQTYRISLRVLAAKTFNPSTLGDFLGQDGCQTCPDIMVT